MRRGGNWVGRAGAAATRAWGCERDVLSDNRAIRPKASGIRFPEITVRYRPAWPTVSRAIGYERIDHGRSDPGRAKAATHRSSSFMPCSVEAGPMGSADVRTDDRGFTREVITDAHRPAPVMLFELRAGHGREGASAFPIRGRGNARFPGPAEPMGCAYGCTQIASTRNLKILSASRISPP